jgi:hypothetical protein
MPIRIRPEEAKMRGSYLIGLMGTVVAGLWCVWLLLLAYRIVGKPAGQDPRYDAEIVYWSRTFKVVGMLGILSVVFQVVALVAGWW